MNVSTTEKRDRLLIFVIAYYAESTLKSVLERIPPGVLTTFDCEILIVDDASEDRTFAIGRQYKEAHPDMPITVLRNTYNQGYGGNQKVGYAYAIANHFDFVAMLHGDGQYAPEELPRLVEPLRARRTDVVFGSRMLHRFAALKGGMPVYKYVGNKILTKIQNILLGTSLSEFHSGYRVYSIRALERVPFLLNSNDFHFDTEIIIQLLNAGMRITELPIPTYYGNEICRVNGIKYAGNVLWATLLNVAHRAGLLYQRRFDPHPNTDAHYELKLGYASNHTYALNSIPAGARVIDIGSGIGGVARELLKKGCTVAVVAQSEAHGSPETAVRTFVQSLDEPVAFSIKDYDVILLLDIVEHLKRPEKFLEDLRTQFDYKPKTLIVTTANVAFIVQRVMLLVGQFNYSKAGILDLTHTRLFTFRSIQRLLLDAGFRIREVRGVPVPFPKVLGHGLLGRAALGVNLLLIRISRTLFSYQIFIRAESTPAVAFILGDAQRQSAASEPEAFSVQRTASQRSSAAGASTSTVKLGPGRGHT
jgi:glycosyltransferase involved in cell wall biosynthesis